jgi:hypothetical protein
MSSTKSGKSVKDDLSKTEQEAEWAILRAEKAALLASDKELRSRIQCTKVIFQIIENMQEDLRTMERYIESHSYSVTIPNYNAEWKYLDYDALCDLSHEGHDETVKSLRRNILHLKTAVGIMFPAF